MSQRIVALTFVALLLVSGMPATSATHTDALTPDIPILPHVKPSQDCAQTTLAPSILARVNKLTAGDPAFFTDEFGAPAVCLSGTPQGEITSLITALDLELERLRNVSREIQHQVDLRLDATLPEGSQACTPAPNSTDASVPLACGLVEPKVTLLEDNFNGRRTTGFGDWKVVTQSGEPALWTPETVETLNGSRTTYRFGDDTGYARGAHQFLVSPELDLTSLKANKTAIQVLVEQRDLARDRARALCYQGANPIPAVTACQYGHPDGDLPAPLPHASALLTAYGLAFDETIYELPVMQQGATLDLTYRLNFAEDLDGVRVWLYTGDRAPDRSVLFDPRLGDHVDGLDTDVGQSCVRDPLYPLTPSGNHATLNGTGNRGEPAGDLQCSTRVNGGQIINDGGGNADRAFNGSRASVRAFATAALGQSRSGALSGDLPEFYTQRFNLTDYLDARVWILFEAKTMRNDRGQDIFGDISLFPRQTSYGFELSRVFAQGDGYLRNLRLKDIGATYPYSVQGNDLADDPRTVRTTTPPGNDSIVVYVHNAGDYTENATFTLNVAAAAKGSSSFNPVGSYTQALRLVPDEVRTLRIPWSQALSNNGTLRENYLYRLDGALSLPGLNVTAGSLTNVSTDGNLPTGLDANNSKVRPANAAGTIPGAGDLTVQRLVRAATIRNLTPVRVDGDVGVPLQFCSAIEDGRKCVELYSARKGESRIAFMGVRNVGNAPQDITADLIVKLDGVIKDDIITGGPRVTLRDLQPNETRPVQWQLSPTEPGSYEVAVALTRENGVTEPLMERHLFVQRTPGLMCLDTLEQRECGPTWSGGLVPILQNEDITASALGADGTLYVATEMNEIGADGTQDGILAARSVDGNWRVLANITPQKLNTLFPDNSFTLGQSTLLNWGDIRSIVPLPDGGLYLAGGDSYFGARLTVLRYFPDGTLQEVPVSMETVDGVQRLVVTALSTGIMHNGTLILGGTNGTLFKLVDQNLTRFTVKHTAVTSRDNTTGEILATASAIYQGTILQLTHAPNGDAFLLGTGGALLRNAIGDTEWKETTLRGAFETNLTSFVVDEARLRSATTFNGRFYVAGEGSLFVNEPGSFSRFVNITQPTPLQRLTATPPRIGFTEFVSIAASHTGALEILDYEGRLASCADCLKATPNWTHPELALPPVVGKGSTHAARVGKVLGDASNTILVGEAGLVMTLSINGVYDNENDWSVVPALAAHDGAVIQTIAQTNGFTDKAQSYLSLPDADGQSVANSATKFRLFMNHSVLQATPEKQLQVRLVYLKFPSFTPAQGTTQVANGGAQNDGINTCPQLGTEPGVGLTTVCGSSRIRHHVTSYTNRSAFASWSPELYDNLPIAAAAVNNVALPGAANAGGSFYGLEFFASKDTRWAIDDYDLQGFVGGKWQTVVEWRGIDAKHGSAFLMDNVTSEANLALRPLSVVLPAELPSGAEQKDQWQVRRGVAFDEEPISPWHITTQYADRPVFAANNEFYINSALSGGSTPRLFSGWDARLVSPIIDLRDAYDAAVTFRHKFAFRVQVIGDTGSVRPGDGGFLEVQYLRQGLECGTPDVTVTCGWSQFFPVKPDSGYPNKDTLGYLPRAYLTGSPGPSNLSRIGVINGSAANNPGEGKSYWGRNAFPDESGVIGAPRLTDTYVTEKVTLYNAMCTPSQQPGTTDCVPANLSGRKIRFAFHMLTAGTWTGGGEDYVDGIFNSSSTGFPTSYAGEGWYITDFKVLGASTLGVDLRATNMSFRVGYDVSSIGVGPGTRVPVNVTVENKGIFDVLGYTGKLEVHKIIDRALKTTQLVEAIQLSQQPVLDVGRSVNHTFLWNVDPAEAAEYMLTFTVTPIGIDRDEDPLDNSARLGSVAQPVFAKTVRRFNTEFLVSPADATIDITRYMPMYLNNTGNVPLDGFTVERRITVIGRAVDSDAQTCAQWRQYVLEQRRTSIVDCRQWLTSRAAPAGSLTPLTALTDDVSPTSDLFWKAPERANFLVSVNAQTNVGTMTLSSGMDRRVSAFATYLFDDVEGGVRGESDSGAWVFDAGWDATQPGFRSTDSYAFGDPLVGRYPADANASIVSPTIDLGSARTASIAFYHKYDFEPGFDAGVLEASADGGRTWTPLPVAADSRTTAGYNRSFPIQPGSPIHPDGDPDHPGIYGFTSDSSLHPSAVDGWVLSTADLTDFANVTEKRVAYEAYTSIEMQGFSPPPVTVTRGINTYSDQNWCNGPAEEFRCWEVQNLTQGTLLPPTGPTTPENTMWWSGSAMLDDDQRRPIENHLLLIPLDITRVTADQVVTADWWEYASRFSTVSQYMRRGDPNTASWDPDLYSVYNFHSQSAAAHTTRYNLGQPQIIETRGKWYHMQADLTELVQTVQAKGVTQLKVGFSYTPITKYGTSASLYDLENADRDHGGGTYGATSGDGRFQDDPGLAIDGFTVKATRLVRGQVLGTPDELATEQTAWEAKKVYNCGTGTTNPGDSNNEWQQGGTSRVACLNDNNGFILNDVMKYPPADDGSTLGRNWGLVTQLPDFNATWNVTNVRDETGHSSGVPLPTGDTPRAWWTGQLPYDAASPTTAQLCAKLVSGVITPLDYPCPQPGSESRLVTPAFDLGRVAGNNAQLTFWHRYAFSKYNTNAGGVNLASGGVVEIQEYDALTGVWSPWKQLYNADKTATAKGGYTAVTANTSDGSEGVRRFDPPFESLRVSGFAKAVQFLYSGKSTADPRNVNGWVEETFDVREYLGKRVRFGFHSYFSDELLLTQGTTRLTDPDGTGTDKAGWWVKDVSLVGSVIVGKPVQVRWRAGTDGNVQEGAWQIDDIGVFGSRYGNNLGLFVDTTPNAFGGYNDSVVKVPVTLRNLGNTVVQDLAIEIINVKPGVALNFTAPGAPDVRYDAGRFYMTGFRLAPGRSVTVDLIVRTPLSATQDTVPLLMQIKKYSADSIENPFSRIVNNEVQGLLSRTVSITLQKEPSIDVIGTVVRKLDAKVNESVDLEVKLRNSGFGPTTLNLTCDAKTVIDWVGVNHLSNPSNTPITSGKYPCTLVGGSLTIPAKTSETLVYRATPTAAGFLAFVVNGSIVLQDKTVDPPPVPARDAIRAGIAVGVSTLTAHWAFDGRRELEQNFSISNNAGGWEYLRGHDAPGALFIGRNDNQTAADTLGTYSQCGSSACIASTVEVDLHNYSLTSPAYLSFWHMDRLARDDGARVVARVKLREQLQGTDAYSDPCILTPRQGWEGSVRQIAPVAAPTGQQQAPFDQNAAFLTSPAQYPNTNAPTPTHFFTSRDGVWEDTWSLAVFDLTQPCIRLEQAHASKTPYTLVGGSVRFDFEVFGSSTPNGVLNRGRGQGMFVDDISVGPHAIQVRPDAAQRATLLDNTTKAFNFVVQNDGKGPDIVTLEYDALRSSAPPDSVVMPAGPFILAPGESRILTGYVTLPRDPSLLPTDFNVRVIARSVIDRNAAGDATLVISFAPREWAELKIVAEAPGNVVQEGTEAFIPITIENLGLVESPNTTIRIIDTWATGSTTIEIPLSNVAAYSVAPEDSTRVVEFRWRPDKASVGLHTLTFAVDPDGHLQEYTKSNNLATLVVRVSDLLISDLHVANFSALTLRNAAGGVVTPGFDADVARYEITAGELVSFEIKVANVGRAGATNVDVRAFIGDLSLPPKTIPYIAPGTEVVVNFNWLAQKGEHKIEFAVRSEQVELTSTNNRYPGLGVTILTVKGYEIEIEIPDIGDILEPGSVIEVPFSIRNAGNAGEDLVLAATSPSGTRLQLPREAFFLRAGETYADNARLILDPEAVAGQQVMSIDAVARENPMKVATGRAAMRVAASYGGSVAGGIAAGAPPGFTLPIELVNEGNSLEPWSITVRLPAGWTSVETLPANVVVPAHGKTTLQLHVNVPASTAPGERQMQVKAQLPNGDQRTGIVKASVLPVRAAGLALSEKASTPDKGALSIPVVVENKGNVQQPFQVLVLDAPEGIALKLEPSTFDLPPGGKAVASLIVTPNASVEAGTYSVTSYSLFEGVTPQTAEGRANLQTIKVPIVRQDLRVSPLEFSPRAGLNTGDRVAVKVTVANRGPAQLTAIPVHLYVDDVFIQESLIRSIAAGARADVTFNWTALDGAHTLTVVVDPYSDTVDADRADNAVSALATVGSAAGSAPGAVAAGRAGTPGPGLFAFLIAAVVAALLVAPSMERNGSRRQRR